MSRKLGKEKDWGSRSGRTRHRDLSTFTLEQRLAFLGVNETLLNMAIEQPEEFQEAAKSLLAIKQSAGSFKKSNKAKKVFETDYGELYRGDCLSTLELMDNDSIDCIFADPPFNLAKDYGKNIDDVLQEELYLEWTRAWLDGCIDKLKPGGALYVYNIPKWAIPIAHHLNQKLTFRSWITVDLTLSMPISGRLYPSHYALLYFIKGKKPRHFAPPRVPIVTCVRCGQEQKDYGGYKKKMNPNGVNIRDVWTDIPPVRHSRYKNRDANELSLKLLDRVLDISTKEGDLVFDPFGGSGTTYVAAELKKRQWVGSELGDCKPIIKRLKMPKEDINVLRRYRKDVNKLFSDDAIEKRYKHGLSLKNYRVEEDQLTSVLGDKIKKMEF